MAGVVSPSMPVWQVTDDAGPAPRHAFATLNEGLGTVLRFGAYGPEVIDRLRWMPEVLGPVLDAAIQASEPIDVTTLIGQALAMGDEGHNRSVAASALLARRLAPAIAPLDGAVEVLRFLAGNDHFALNLSMAAAKLCMDAAAHVPGSSLVTVMSRNGVEFGIRVAGTGDRWYTAPVGPADGLFFPGYGPDDANPDMGDSAITETLGIGGFAMAASPSITTFVGGTPADALAASRSMRRITLAPHPAFPLPPLNFAGSPSGIDVLKVLDTCELPLINTGIAHREAGVGQIGAGIVTAPPEVFLAAVHGLAAARGVAHDRHDRAGGRADRDRRERAGARGRVGLVVPAAGAVGGVRPAGRRAGRGRVAGAGDARQRAAGRLHPAPRGAGRPGRHQSRGCPSFRCGWPSPTRRAASGTCCAWPSTTR